MTRENLDTLFCESGFTIHCTGPKTVLCDDINTADDNFCHVVLDDEKVEIETVQSKASFKYDQIESFDFKEDKFKKTITVTTSSGTTELEWNVREWISHKEIISKLPIVDAEVLFCGNVILYYRKGKSVASISYKDVADFWFTKTSLIISLLQEDTEIVVPKEKVFRL